MNSRFEPGATMVKQDAEPAGVLDERRLLEILFR
jgi:hypothetical protein